MWLSIILFWIKTIDYREYIEKRNIVDNNEDDTMEYDFIKTYQYKPEKNGNGLTGEEFVTIAHPLILSPMLAVNVDRRDLLQILQTAIKELLHESQDIFFTGRLWDLLYDGIILDCSSDSFESKAACDLFGSGDYKEFRRINETAFSFSMFGNVNIFKHLVYTYMNAPEK